MVILLSFTKLWCKLDLLTSHLQVLLTLFGAVGGLIKFISNQITYSLGLLERTYLSNDINSYFVIIVYVSVRPKKIHFISNIIVQTRAV